MNKVKLKSSHVMVVIRQYRNVAVWNVIKTYFIFWYVAVAYIDMNTMILSLISECGNI